MTGQGSREVGFVRRAGGAAPRLSLACKAFEISVVDNGIRDTFGVRNCRWSPVVCRYVQQHDRPTGSLAEQLRVVADEIATLTDLPPTSATVEEMAGLLVQLETLQNQLAGVAATWTAAFDAAGGPDEHGAPSLNVWAAASCGSPRPRPAAGPGAPRPSTRCLGVRAAFTAGPVRARGPGPDRPRAAPDGCRHHRRGGAGAAPGR